MQTYITLHYITLHYNTLSNQRRSAPIRLLFITRDQYTSNVSIYRDSRDGSKIFENPALNREATAPDCGPANWSTHPLSMIPSRYFLPLKPFEKNC